MARLFRRDGDAPKKSLWQRIKEVATTDVGVILRGGVKDGSLEELEEGPLGADFGRPTPLQLVDKIGGYAQQGYIRTEAEFQDALRRLVEAELVEGNSDPALVRPAGGPAGRGRAGGGEPRPRARAAGERPRRVPRGGRERGGEDDVHRQARVAARQAAPA